MAEGLSPRFQQLLRYIFQLKEAFSGALLEDVFPTFPLQDPAEPFLQLYKDTFTVFGGATVTPAATDVATSDLAPADANTHVALDVLLVSIVNRTAAAQNVSIEHIGFAGGQPTTPLILMTPLDGRRIGSENNPQRSRYGFSTQVAGFIANNGNAFVVSAAPNSGLVLPFRATLQRSALRFKASPINTQMTVAAYGHERVLEPSEERSKVSVSP
jgi:hypothetical protein